MINLRQMWVTEKTTDLTVTFNSNLYLLCSTCQITWWRWSTAHGLEVLGSGFTDVCWGRQGVPSRRSTGILGWRVTVGTNFSPWCFSRFPRRFVKSPFLMTGRSWRHACTWRKFNDCIRELTGDSFRAMWAQLQWRDSFGLQPSFSQTL